MNRLSLLAALAAAALLVGCPGSKSPDNGPNRSGRELLKVGFLPVT